MSGAERMVGAGLTRRGLLGVASVAAVLGACSGSQTGQRRGSTPSAPSKPQGYAEAPMLAARVRSGTLPPVAERLPKEPYVVRPGVLVNDEFVHLQPGKFGGTLRTPGGILESAEPLLWAPDGIGNTDGKAIAGNVLAGYEANGDSTVFTFHLREGMRWSDGEPVTTADVRFAFEDVLNNAKVTAVFPVYLRAGSRSDRAPAKLTVIDEWTFSLTFDAAYGSFLAQISGGQYRGYEDFIKPRHYLEQFHEKYASAAKLQQELKKASLPADQWFNLFNAKQLAGWWAYSTDAFIDHPVLMPWVLATAQGQVKHFERNPYYFKVDSAGNQLPYIDKVRSEGGLEGATSFSKALMGEFDMGFLLSLRELSLVVEKADKGEVSLLISRLPSVPGAYVLNLTNPDKVWRQVTGDLRFRQALSMAINREEIIENFYLGEFASLPTRINPSTYDPVKANQLLDEMGMSGKDAEGYRLGPDGKRFTIPIEFFDLNPDYPSRAELVAEFWKRVGVYTTVRKIAVNLWSERQGANQLKATVLQQESEIWASGTFDDYLPGVFGPAWLTWYNTQGKQGEEPPAEVKELFEAHGRFKSAVLGSPESKAAYEAIEKSWRDNIWMFNPTEKTYVATFQSSRVKNNAKGIKKDVNVLNAQFSTEQWYIDE